MSLRRVLASVAAVAIGVGGLALISPAPARALGSIESPCLPGGITLSCSSSGLGGRVVSSASSALTSVTLGAVVTWVVGGAKYVLTSTAQVLSKTAAPQLTSTWFSATYWRVAGIAAVLTLPFLFAAAVQALIRSDLSLLLRAALGYLPLALLAVGIAAPLTMLLLAASDQMSAVVASAAGDQGVDFLGHATGLLSEIAASFASPFVLFLVGLLTVAGALVLWIELLVREAAVYVIVLMLPLAFAAFVWPARRVWVIRSIELLVALILSKFAIIAVLSLGGAALDQSANRSVTGLLAGGVLVVLAAFAPWAMLRLIPLAEVAGAAAGSLTAGPKSALRRLQQSDARASQIDDWISKIAQMREAARDGSASQGDDDAPPRPAREAAPTPVAPESAPASTAESAPASTAESAPASSLETSPPDSPLPPIHHGSDGGKPRIEIEQPDPASRPSDPSAPT